MSRNPRTLSAVIALCISGTLLLGPFTGVAHAGDVKRSSETSSKDNTPKKSSSTKDSSKKSKDSAKQPKKQKKQTSARFPREGTRLGMMFIPRLKVRSPIVEGVTDPMFDIGMGHWPGTAMPGERGNAVYGGHRTAGPRPLYNVEKMQVGDPIVVLRGLKRHEYRVISKRIVRPTALWITHQSSGSTLTLFTCHPRHSTKQRYVIQAILKK
jgi:LPXTG-site transpeptidase (sortase) family protein